MNICPVHGCEKELTNPWQLLCTDHYFALEPHEARFLVKMKILTKRARTDAERKHLASQLPGYVRQMVNKIEAAR